MAKIRGIKPDTWTDEKFVAVSPLARLLFIGMWNYACDNGHLEDSPLQLKMRILPADNCDPAALVDELVGAGLVIREMDYLKVPTLPGHQKPDKRFLTFCSRCEHDENCAYTDAKPAARTSSAPRAHPEPPTSAPRVHIDEGDGDGECEGESTTRPIGAAAPPELDEVTESVVAELLPIADNLPAIVEPDRFDEWWATYDKKTGKRKAEQKWRVALRKPGVTADLLIDAARTYIDHQKGAGKHPQYTKNPETWLNGEHWRDDVRAFAPPRRGTRMGDLTNDDWAAAAARLAERSNT